LRIWEVVLHSLIICSCPLFLIVVSFSLHGLRIRTARSGVCPLVLPFSGSNDATERLINGHSACRSLTPSTTTSLFMREHVHNNLMARPSNQPTNNDSDPLCSSLLPSSLVQYAWRPCLVFLDDQMDGVTRSVRKPDAHTGTTGQVCVAFWLLLLYFTLGWHTFGIMACDDYFTELSKYTT
jgi:hypothetical protein